MGENLLKISGSPHIHGEESVHKIMWSVVIALMPAFIVSIIYFGLPALFLTLLSVASCVLFEYLIQRFMLKEPSTIGDGSAVITGLLIAFCVPSNLNPLILILGDLVGIGIAKMAFGGLGKNIFNPAITARVFLLISFPAQMTTWPTPQPIWKLTGFADAITGPSPLSILKENTGNVNEALANMPTNLQMLFGQMGGSLGEVSALAILIGCIFLLIRKVITWHIPVSFLLSAFIFGGIFWIIDPTQYANPFFHLITGGMLLGACFMATDMVTSPTSPWGMIIFGTGCGIITMIIRMFGAYPEGVSFAILIMNAFVPLIDKAFKPKMFGC